MNIFPAIDLRNQKCVRLTKGEFSSEKIYNEDPIRQAEIFFKNGLKYLHIIDPPLFERILHLLYLDGGNYSVLCTCSDLHSIFY